MSISYLIAFDKDLNKTEYLYKFILKSKQTVWNEDDGINFSDKLYPQEQDIAKTMFPQRKVYSIRSSVPLAYKQGDKEAVCDSYYNCEKEQLAWFINFLKKQIKCDEDVLFLKINLGSLIDYSKILSKRVDLNDLELPQNEFNFDNCVYQFVNCKKNDKTL